MSFSDWVLPLFTVGTVLFGVIKKVNVWDCFTEGAAQGLKTFASILPSLTGLMIAVTMLRASGAEIILERLLAPVFSLFGIPREVIPLCILSPVSGSGSLSVFESILADFGADSYAGRVASVIAGATETTFYAVAVYFGSVGIKKSGAVIPAALIGDFVSFVTAAASVRWMFGV